MTVTIFSKKSCVQCTATYRALDKAGIPYEVIDLQEDPAAFDFVMALGHIQAPVVLVHDGDWPSFVPTQDNKASHWSGFRPDMVKALHERLSALV